MSDVIFRSVSAVALLLMIVQFAGVAAMALRRIRHGSNGYTQSILYWAGASIIYSLNEILRVYLMGLDTFPFRANILLIGSAVTRVVMVAAVTHLMYRMRQPKKARYERGRERDD